MIRFDITFSCFIDVVGFDRYVYLIRVGRNLLFVYLFCRKMLYLYKELNEKINNWYVEFSEVYNDILNVDM